MLSAKCQVLIVKCQLKIRDEHFAFSTQHLIGQ